MGICTDAITRAADQSEEALEVLNAAESSLMEVTERGITSGFAGIPEIVRDSFGTIDNLYKQGREITGLETHYKDFDRMTSGLQHSELIIIAARPTMGKTAWAINIAENCAVKGGKVVAVFSLEMSKESLLRRMLASQAMVNTRHIQMGYLAGNARREADTCAGPSWWSQRFSSTTRRASRSRRCAPRHAACGRSTAASTSSWWITCS